MAAAAAGRGADGFDDAFGMGGFEATRKNRAQYPQTQVIALTSFQEK